MPGTLYIVATPIGNLADITFRAVETLKAVDLILCEDTRVTAKLLARYDIKKPLVSYHQHSDLTKINEIKKNLADGKNIALVTDAGTPGISDPGNMLIQSVIASPEGAKQSQSATEILDASLGLPRRRFAPPRNDRNAIVPIPGVSAIITALSVSGFPTDKFIFLGFPPHKNKRQKFFQEAADAKYTVAFYESSHRIKKALEELADVLGNGRKVCVCRELTKKFESIYRGSIEEILNQNISEKGEFVVLVSR